MPMSFPPRDVIKTSLQSDLFPGQKDISFNYQNVHDGIGHDGSPWLRPTDRIRSTVKHLDMLGGAQSLNRPLKDHIDALRKANKHMFDLITKSDNPWTSPLRDTNIGVDLFDNKPGNSKESMESTSGEIFSSFPADSSLIPDTTAPSGPNVIHHNNVEVISKGPVDIPYTVESLGLGRSPRKLFRDSNNGSRSFEAVPLSFKGNDIIVGKSNTVPVTDTRNPKNLGMQNTFENNLTPKIQGVDFASAIKGNHVDTGIHQMGPIPQDVLNAASSGGTQFKQDVFNANFDATLSDNVNRIVNGDLQRNPLLAKGPVTENINSGLNVQNKLSGINVDMQLPSGTSGTSANDGLPIETGQSKRLITVENILAVPDINPNRGGKHFRYSGYMLNIEPFGPGPYGQCRLPAEVECGARPGWEHVKGMNEWCKRNCVVFMYTSYCDDDRCDCDCTQV